jgi:branched-chain amino acid transport system permease protein
MPLVIGFLEWKQHQHKINSACDLGQTSFPPSPYLRTYIVNRWDPSLMELFLEQTLNGLQAGFTLLMIASGLTLIFGMMGVLNLAHGSLFMVGAFVAADVGARTGSFELALLTGVLGAMIAGIVMETVVIRFLYVRDHLDQVLATFGLVLMANQGVQMLWGIRPRTVSRPRWLEGGVTVLPGLTYPIYRLAIIVAGMLAILALWLLIERTRVGMWIKAGNTHRQLLGALGVNVTLLFTGVFALGAGLAGFAGVVAAPYLTVESGMGDTFLILSFVVIVIGGIGSIKGALIGSLLIGLVDTWGQTYLPILVNRFTDPSTAASVGSSLASASIYLLMAVVLLVRPEGLYGGARG